MVDHKVDHKYGKYIWYDTHGVDSLRTNSTSTLTLLLLYYPACGYGTIGVMTYVTSQRYDCCLRCDNADVLVLLKLLGRAESYAA